MEIPSWAMEVAGQIIKERDNENYICASGISVSGILHIGKLRDVFIAHSVNRALREYGKQSKLVYFVDDFDRLKKRPKDLPETYDRFIGAPYAIVPDPCKEHNSFVNHYLEGFLKSINLLSICPEKIIYESERYKQNFYSEEIKTIFDNRDRIVRIVNSIRHKSKRKFEESRLFVIYCPECRKDNQKSKRVMDKGDIEYSCMCGFEGRIDILDGNNVKMSWIANWPSRWKKERTDFEPIGPDHASPMGAFEVSSSIAREILGIMPPHVQRYEFIHLKGSGKLSSSGTAVSLEDFLKIYETGLVVDLFSSKRPESFFEISSGKDIMNMYERYDKRRNTNLPTFSGVVSALNSLCLDKNKTLEELSKKKYSATLSERVEKALNWIKEFAPAEYSFSIKERQNSQNIGESELKALLRTIEEFRNLNNEKDIEDVLYDTSREFGLEPRMFFSLLYKIIIGKERGPKIARLIMNNKEKTISLLEKIIGDNRPAA